MHGPKLMLGRVPTSLGHGAAIALGLTDEAFTDEQIRLLEALEKHRVAELEVKDVDQTLATMVDEPYLLFLGSLTGGAGQAGVRRFYTGMISQLPSDLAWELISRTVGANQIVIESILTFTHNVPVDWLIPGIAPTNKILEIPIVLIFTFENRVLASERIYWDQASVLVQLDLLEHSSLPVVGSEAARELRKLTTGIGND